MLSHRSRGKALAASPTTLKWARRLKRRSLEAKSWLLVVVWLAFTLFVWVNLRNAPTTVSPAPADVLQVNAADDTIFVLIASYRDSQCRDTIASLFSKAAKPHRITVGVYQQNMNDTDVDCVSFRCPGEVACDYLDNIRIRRVDYMEGLGPVTGRHFAELLLRDERFAMQVDSHTFFAPNWDDTLVELWTELDDEYAVLSNYPNPVSTINATNYGICVICTAEFETVHQMVKNKAFVVHLPKSLNGRSMLVPLWGAGLSFSRSHRVRAVPYDGYAPYLFDGEEFGLLARMWTNGYNIYTPAENVVFHVYASEVKRPHFWEVEWRRRFPIAQRSAARMQILLGGDVPSKIPLEEVDVRKLGIGEKYGLGTMRSIEELSAFTGVDVRDHAMTSRCNDAVANKLVQVPARRPAGYASPVWAMDEEDAGRDAYELASITLS